MKQVTLNLLTAPGCSHCEAFKSFWHDVEKDWGNVTFNEISVTTPEGQELVKKHAVFASPGVIINDELFSTGAVDTAKFIEHLQEISA